MGWSRDRVGAGSLGVRFPVGARPRRAAALSGAGGAAASPAPPPWGVHDKLWAGDTRGGVDWRRWTPSLTVRGHLVSRATPAGSNDSRAGSERPGWGRHAHDARGAGCREERGWGGRGRMRPAPVPYWNESERGAPLPPPPPERGWRGAGRAAGRPAPPSPVGRRARAGERGRCERIKRPCWGTKGRIKRKKTSARGVKASD